MVALETAESPVPPSRRAAGPIGVASRRSHQATQCSEFQAQAPPRRPSGDRDPARNLTRTRKRSPTRTGGAAHPKCVWWPWDGPDRPARLSAWWGGSTAAARATVGRCGPTRPDLPGLASRAGWPGPARLGSVTKDAADSDAGKPHASPQPLHRDFRPSQQGPAVARHRDRGPRAGQTAPPQLLELKPCIITL